MLPGLARKARITRKGGPSGEGIPSALRQYTTGILRELGYRVLEAESGVAAPEILALQSDIELVFTDVVMPGGVNGRQLAEAALLARPGIKVLFTTGYTRNAIIHHGRLDPGANLIVKSYSFRALAAKIRTLLDE